MPNNIALAQRFVPVMDEKYKLGSFTSFLEAGPNDVRNFDGVNKIEIFEMELQGLGTYDRTNGYPRGVVTGTWTPYQLAYERGREFAEDRLNNEELFSFVMLKNLL